MKRSYGTLAATFGVLGLALLAVPNCAAQCGGRAIPLHSSWRPQPGQLQLLPAAFVTTDDRDNDDVSIVGFWHFKFVSGSKTVDSGFQQFHSDGTEIENTDVHPPNTSNFCLGVWEKVGTRQYKLNHFALPWDPTLGQPYPNNPNIPMGEPVGTVHITGNITLAPDGKSFAGTFTSILYDESGKSVSASYQEGAYTGTRVTVSTPASSVL